MISSSHRLPSPGDPSPASGGETAITRRRLAGLAGLTLAAGLPTGALTGAASARGATRSGSDCRRPRPPRLPAGFTKTFASRYVDVGAVRLHAMVGGEGPPLLLVHGWPEDWYAWRHVMPALAQNHRVVAVDQRGIGRSDKPRDGYDAGTLANDLVRLMEKLGHERFAVVGHDTGFIIGYAMAADHPERVERVALAEIPGPPGALPAPPLFIPEPLNNRLWHIPFNRVDKLPEQLVTGREDIFFGYEFAIQGGKVPAYAVRYYVSMLRCDRNALRGSFGIYRAWDATVAQNAQRSTQPLTMPVLAIGGERSYGAAVGDAMKALAPDVQSVVLPGTGHWVAEEAPQKLLASLTPFLASS